MTPDDLRDITAPTSANNHLVPDKLAPARCIAGTIGFIVTMVRVDAYLAFCIIARCLNTKRFTCNVWTCLLRLAHYLIGTIDLPLTLRRVPPEAEMIAYVDSAHGNIEGGRSQGGFFCCYPGSGALCWSSSAPAASADSSSAPELHQATRCVKAIAGLRILHRELWMPPSQPTVTYTDSQVVIDDTKSEKVS